MKELSYIHAGNHFHYSPLTDFWHLLDGPWFDNLQPEKDRQIIRKAKFIHISETLLTTSFVDWHYHYLPYCVVFIDAHIPEPEQDRFGNKIIERISHHKYAITTYIHSWRTSEGSIPNNIDESSENRVFFPSH